MPPRRSNRQKAPVEPEIVAQPKPAKSKATKGKAKPSKAAPPNAPSTASSFAREVYETPELRQRIIALLSQHDWTSFIRVERKVMCDVAKELYRTVDYDRVRSKMSSSTPRQRMYTSAVHTINARNITSLPSTVLAKTTLVISSNKHREEETEVYLQQYEPSVINALVPSLQAKCENIRVILMGAEYEAFGKDSWEIHLVRKDEDAEGRVEEGHADGKDGYVDINRTVTFDPSSEPPTAIDPPSLPDRLSVRWRYDLNLYHHPGTNIFKPARSLVGTYVDQWLKTLREASWPLAVRAVHLDFLPVTLDHLGELYERQISAGWARGLETIIAPCLVAWSVDQLSSFSLLAGSSLTSLDLVTSSYLERSFNTTVSFADLPSMTTIVRDHLPNLNTLRIALLGIETAEADCRAATKEGILNESGSVRDLRIVTAELDNTPPLFNTVRYASRMCTAIGNAGIAIGPHLPDGDRKNVWGDQTLFLGYLKKQPDIRKAHLHTIDFSSLGLASPREVYDLTYTDEGVPRGRAQSMAALWAGEVRGLLGDEKVKEIAGFETKLGEVLERCEMLEVTPVPLKETLAKVQVLLETAGAAQKLGGNTGPGLGIMVIQYDIMAFEASVKKQINSQ